MTVEDLFNSTVEEAFLTSHDNVSLSPDVECRNFVFILYVPIFGFICLFGVLGNSLSFVVLQWEKKNAVATFLLQALAMADNLFLLTAGASQISSAVSLYYDLDDSKVKPYIKVFLWPMVHITQFGTIWMTVLIAASRWIAICRPFRAHKLCTMTKVRIQVGLVVLLSILYNFSHFFEYTLSPQEPNETAMKNNRVYQLMYESALYCLFVFLGPLIVLVGLNAGLIRELWTARQRLISRQIPMPGEEEEQNITLVMVVIVLIFVVCQTPAFINQLLFYSIDVDVNYQCHKPYYYYYHLSNLLISANSATNFIVYCVFRQQFRERLYNFCHHRSRALKHSDTYSPNGRTASVYSKNCQCDAV